MLFTRMHATDSNHRWTRNAPANCNNSSLAGLILQLMQGYLQILVDEGGVGANHSACVFQKDVRFLPLICSSWCRRMASYSGSTLLMWDLMMSAGGACVRSTSYAARLWWSLKTL